MADQSASSAESISDSLGSVTMMYQRAVDGDSQAPRELWEAYSKRLFGLARSVLRQRGVAPAHASEDSIVNEAFAKFFDAISKGKYGEVADRHELWCLLAVVTRNKAINRVAKARPQAAHFVDVESSILEQAHAGPTGEEVAALSDTIDVIEQKIRDRAKNDEQADRIIRVMTMTLSGHTQQEIASEIGQAEITVRRNLTMIRRLLDGAMD